MSDEARERIGGYGSPIDEILALLQSTAVLMGKSSISFRLSKTAVSLSSTANVDSGLNSYGEEFTSRAMTMATAERGLMGSILFRSHTRCGFTCYKCGLASVGSFDRCACHCCPHSQGKARGCLQHLPGSQSPPAQLAQTKSPQHRGELGPSYLTTGGNSLCGVSSCQCCVSSGQLLNKKACGATQRGASWR